MFKSKTPEKTNQTKEVPIYCHQCTAGPDFLKVVVEDGVARRVVPNFDIKNEHPACGRVCVKAYGFIQKTYNPNRIKQPMRRTNPNKGRNEDPGFISISWDEAFDIIGKKMRSIRAEGLNNEDGVPRLAVTIGAGGTPVSYMGTFPGFMAAWGALDQGYGAGQGIKCAHSEHLYGELWHRAFTVSPDTPKSNYIISCGANADASNGTVGIWREADARARGVKRIQLEPHQSVTAATAAEWVPIKPKSDTAFLYALIHRIIIERPIEETCDLPFLKERTNSPYLVGPNGWFLRDGKSGKPLVWDLSDNLPKTYDSEIGDAALTGSFTVSGDEIGPDDEKISHQDIQVKTSFQVLCDQLHDNSADWAENECDIPAKTIRRIADEFVAAACIGQFTEIEGHKIPFRPVSVLLGKNANNGWGAYNCCWARTMLTCLVGALEVPGGMLGTTVKLNRPASSRVGSVIPGPDGFMTYPFNPTSRKEWHAKPELSRNAFDTLVPLVGNSPWSQSLGPAHLPWLFQKERPKNWPRTAPPDMWICYRSNPVISMWNSEKVMNSIVDFPFIVSLAYTMDETNHFADILLPESTDLESTQLIRIGSTKFAQNYWRHEGWAIRQKTVEQVYDTMDMSDIATRLSKEACIYHEYINAINNGAGSTRLVREGKYDYALSHDEELSSEKIWDRVCKAASWDLSEGKEIHGLEWFKENGHMLKDYKEIDWYLYPAMELQGLRFELPYQERLTRHGRELKNRLHESGIDWWDEQLEEYEFIPGYQSFSDIWLNYAREFDRDPDDYPFWTVTSRSMQYAWGANVDIPIIKEMADNVAGHAGIVINRSKALELGIADGEKLVVESVTGFTEGKAVLREGIRPDTLLMLGNFAHWKTPYAKDLARPNINKISDLSLKLTDGTGSGSDLVRVRITKVGDREFSEKEMRS